MTHLFLVPLLWSLTCHAFDIDKALILKPPTGKTGVPAVWVVLPGAQIAEETYKPLAEAVQEHCSSPLWVAVLGSYLTPTPIPPELGARIDYVLKTMQSQGLDLKQAKVFYGGHSLGSVFIQDHLAKNHGASGPLAGSVEVFGQVLMGGFIQRKYTYPEWSYPVSTLTIGGELDGLARPTRLAEALFHSQDRKADFPVVVLPGVTHMQFASGAPPTLVKLRDLKPEISYEDAHEAIAVAVASYFTKLMGGVDGGAASKKLASLQDATGEFCKPIIQAYLKEGARWMGTPTQFGGPDETNCVLGHDKGACPSSSPWAPEAQRVITRGIAGWSFNVTNQYVSLSSTPITGGAFHLPVITNDTSKQTISITTYSQNYWDDATPSWFDWKEIFDSFDTGFVATSAEEIATKLASRQCVLIQGIGEANTSFSVDDASFCRTTNEEAYAWAIKNAGFTTAARFEKLGQKFVFGDDVPKSGGPLWINARLQFGEQKDATTGETVAQVISPACKTEIDYWTHHFGPIPRPPFLPDPGCYHYCKLLSPARAMEWIYVDSLRAKGGLISDLQEIIV